MVRRNHLEFQRKQMICANRSQVKCLKNVQKLQVRSQVEAMAVFKSTFQKMKKGQNWAVGKSSTKKTSFKTVWLYKCFLNEFSFEGLEAEFSLESGGLKLLSLI